MTHIGVSPVAVVCTSTLGKIKQDEIFFDQTVVTGEIRRWLAFSWWKTAKTMTQFYFSTLVMDYSPGARACAFLR